MSIYRLQITAGPTTGSAVFADLSTDDVWCLAEGLDLGSPEASFDAAGFPLERAREISLTLHISKKAGVGVVMQQTARAISVPDRWLLIQRTYDTDPVWYRIHPASPGTLDMSTAWVDRGDGYWTWSLSLTTDSTAVGERRAVPADGSSEPAKTVTNTGTSRGVVIKAPGEAPTPLRVDVAPDQTVNGKRVLVSTFSVPEDSPLITDGDPSIIFEDTDFLLRGVGTVRSNGKAFLSGGNGLTTPMDSFTLRSWAEGPQVGTEGLEPGRYMVMARLYREGSAGELIVRMAQRWGTTNAFQEWRPWRPTAGGDRSSWLPLGFVDHPYGSTGEGLLPGELMPPVILIQQRATVTDPTAVTHLDQVAFVPVGLARGANESAMFSAFEQGIGASGPQGLSWRFDAQHRSVHVVDAFGKIHSTPTPLRTGGWPVAVPGMATGVSVFLDTSEAPTGVDPIDATSQVTVWCSPRQLHVGRER